MWDAIETLGYFIEKMPVCLSEIMVMRFWMSGVAVLVDVVVVLHAHYFKCKCDDCD
jgi:hypothetical protein